MRKQKENRNVNETTKSGRTKGRVNAANVNVRSEHSWVASEIKLICEFTYICRNGTKIGTKNETKYKWWFEKLFFVFVTRKFWFERKRKKQFCGAGHKYSKKNLYLEHLFWSLVFRLKIEQIECRKSRDSGGESGEEGRREEKLERLQNLIDNAYRYYYIDVYYSKCVPAHIYYRIRIHI